MSDKLPSTMGSPSVNRAGVFGVKPRVNIPSATEDNFDIDEEKDKIDAEMKENASTEEVEEVKNEGKGEDGSNDATEKENTESGQVAQEKDTSFGMDEEFECGVCKKSFKQKIALSGHMRGPCGNKSKEVKGNK